MEITVQLLKMHGVEGSPVQYFLPCHGNKLFVNEWVGSHIELRFAGEIHCINCGKPILKTYGQGYCYPCFISVPETSECVLKPELCQAHLGISRDMEWSKQHCLQDHIVYLALTSGVKVGVTRLTQIPDRWIDQGAWKAIRLAQVPNRYTAGIMEVALKKYLSDKTNWRNMLTDIKSGETDLLAVKRETLNYLPDDLKPYYSNDDSITTLIYPVKEYPSRVRQINLERDLQFSGVLAGIRGQYLILERGEVLNIRAHQGYVVTIRVE